MMIASVGINSGGNLEGLFACENGAGFAALLETMKNPANCGVGSASLRREWDYSSRRLGTRDPVGEA